MEVCAQQWPPTEATTPGPARRVLAARPRGRRSQRGWTALRSSARRWPAAEPRARPGARSPTEDTSIEVRDLQVHFALNSSRQVAPDRPRRAVREGASTASSFDLREGEVLGLVGESGSGQDHARPGPARPGPADRRQRSSCAARSSSGCRSATLRPKRRHLQMVFQDPHASLNPGDDAGDGARAPAADPQAHEGSAETQRAGPRDARAGRACRRSTTSPPSYPSGPVGRPEAARGDGAGDHHRPGPRSSPTSPSRCST